MAQDLDQFSPPKNQKALKRAETQIIGRPPKDESERMSKKISINFTADEKERLTRIAKEKGLPVTILIRTLLMEHDYI